MSIYVRIQEFVKLKEQLEAARQQLEPALKALLELADLGVYPEDQLLNVTLLPNCAVVSLGNLEEPTCGVNYTIGNAVLKSDTPECLIKSLIPKD